MRPGVVEPGLFDGLGLAQGALRRLARFCDSDGHRFWPDDLTLRDSMDDVTARRLQGHHQLTDFHLAALAERPPGAPRDVRWSAAAVARRHAPGAGGPAGGMTRARPGGGRADAVCVAADPESDDGSAATLIAPADRRACPQFTAGSDRIHLFQVSGRGGVHPLGRDGREGHVKAEAPTPGRRVGERCLCGHVNLDLDAGALGTPEPVDRADPLGSFPHARQPEDGPASLVGDVRRDAAAVVAHTEGQYRHACTRCRVPRASPARAGTCWRGPRG